MKTMLSCSMLLLGALHAQYALAGTCPFMTGVDPIEKELGELKLKFVGVTPKISWSSGAETPKIVIKKYSHEPLVEEKDGHLVVTAGSCMAEEAEEAASDGDSTTSAPAPDVNATDTDDNKDASAASRNCGNPSKISMLLGGVALGAAGLSSGRQGGSPRFATVGVGIGFSALAYAATLANGQATTGGPKKGVGSMAGCSASMEVEIHTTAGASGSMSMADVDAAVAKAMKTGQFTECPAETAYFEYSKETIYKGYKGCVGDAGMVPCETDGFMGHEGQTELMKPYVFDLESGTCTKQKGTKADQVYWILWGLPMDTVELNKRTGMNPVVHFPLNRGSYPSHAWGSHGDEGLEAKAVEKQWQAYLGAFTPAELESWEVVLTEGTEQGMGMLYAAMMMHIARTTCNRQIYLLVEAPTYGYNTGAATRLANLDAKSFFNHSSCSCFADDSCKTGNLKLTRVGWFPNQPLPTAKGDDGKDYSPDSNDAASPWFERMVWPENPTGDWDRKQQGPADRLVCDGCYTYPTYFPGGEIPISSRPDCSGWAFSLTKMYSATVRTGTLMVKKGEAGDNGIADTMMKVAGEVHGIHNGIYSQWMWEGGIQIKKMLMAKKHEDPTSFVGAYTAIMKEKWEMLTAAFADCPVVEITNGPQTGAYVWFKFKPEYIGLEDGMITSWFMQTLGVMTTTYYFGFRGTDPADYYGPGYSTYDFTRLQLYRDIGVYQEVAKRAEIVCGGGHVDHAYGKFLSTAEWKEAKMAATRRLSENGGKHPETVAERARHLQEAVPRLTDGEAKILADQQHEAHQIHTKVEQECEPLGYPMSCLFQHTGGYSRPDVSLL